MRSCGGNRDCVLTAKPEAAELLVRFGSLPRLARASEAQLTRVVGIGPAQAARLAATLELSRRLQGPPADDQPRVTSPAAAEDLLMPDMRRLDQEEIRVILLDTRNRVLGVPTIYRASLNTSILRIAEIFRPAIEMPAAAVILAHNHPSGDPTPSPEDVRATRDVHQVGRLLGADVLDHTVTGAGTFLSLKEMASVSTPDLHPPFSILPPQGNNLVTSLKALPAQSRILDNGKEDVRHRVAAIFPKEQDRLQAL